MSTTKERSIDYDCDYDFDFDHDEPWEDIFDFEEDDYCCWHPMYRGDRNYCACKEHQEYIEAQYNTERNQIIAFIQRKYYSIKYYLSDKFKRKNTNTDFDDLPF